MEAACDSFVADSLKSCVTDVCALPAVSVESHAPFVVDSGSGCSLFWTSCGLLCRRSSDVIALCGDLLIDSGFRISSPYGAFSLGYNCGQSPV